MNVPVVNYNIIICVIVITLCFTEVSMDEYYPDASSKENAAVLKQAGENNGEK